jgi:hypothetical protein
MGVTAGTATSAAGASAVGASAVGASAVGAITTSLTGAVGAAAGVASASSACVTAARVVLLVRFATLGATDAALCEALRARCGRYDSISATTS